MKHVLIALASVAATLGLMWTGLHYLAVALSAHS